MAFLLRTSSSGFAHESSAKVCTLFDLKCPVVSAAVSKHNEDWTITRIFSGSLARMQAQYGLKYL
jgi:hypothetical protein